VNQSAWLASSVGASFREIVSISVAFQLLVQTGVEGAKRTALGLALVIVLFGLAGHDASEIRCSGDEQWRHL
jgi:hypothetical protein